MTKPTSRSSTARPKASDDGVSSLSMSPSLSLSTKYGPMPTKAFTSDAPTVIADTVLVEPSLRVTSWSPPCWKQNPPCR